MGKRHYNFMLGKQVEIVSYLVSMLMWDFHLFQGLKELKR
jgi:hypothetical protein